MGLCYNSIMVNRFRLILGLALVFVLSPWFVKAQTGSSATISSPDSAVFPTIQFFLEAQNTEGQFIHGLSTSQVKAIENGISLPITEIHEDKPGVQFVTVINPGPSFAVRNSQAISRYDTISQTLSNWAKSRVGTNIDDLSLIINNGPEISHVSDAREWVDVFESAQVDARNAVANLDGLFRGGSDRK